MSFKKSVSRRVTITKASSNLDARKGKVKSDKSVSERLESLEDDLGYVLMGINDYIKKLGLNILKYISENENKPFIELVRGNETLKDITNLSEYKKEIKYHKFEGEEPTNKELIGFLEEFMEKFLPSLTYEILPGDDLTLKFSDTKKRLTFEFMPHLEDPEVQEVKNLLQKYYHEKNFKEIEDLFSTIGKFQDMSEKKHKVDAYLEVIKNVKPYIDEEEYPFRKEVKK